MKFKIDKYLLKKTEELAFITVKKDGDFHLDGYEIPKDGLNVPIKNEVLVKGIKEKTEYMKSALKLIRSDVKLIQIM